MESQESEFEEIGIVGCCSKPGLCCSVFWCAPCVFGETMSVLYNAPPYRCNVWCFACAYGWPLPSCLGSCWAGLQYDVYKKQNRLGEKENDEQVPCPCPCMKTVSTGTCCCVMCESLWCAPCQVAKIHFNILGNENGPGRKLLYKTETYEKSWARIVYPYVANTVNSMGSNDPTRGQTIENGTSTGPFKSGKQIRFRINI